MSKRNKIQFNKPEEPAFIKRMKEKIGFKEGPTVDSKKEVLVRDDDIDDLDDEKPTVLVLKSGDLTEEEANQIQEAIDEAPGDGKIVFKKPNKKSEAGEKKPTLNTSTKHTSTTTSTKRKLANEDSDPSSSAKAKSDRKLLSFDDDEEED